MTRRLVLFATLVIVLLAFSSAWAQDATPEPTAEATQQSTILSYGTPVTGTLDDTNFTQNWTLNTASADRVMVTVTRTSGNLIPDVQILDATGNAIADSYGADYTYAAAQIDDYTFPDRGEYTVAVSRDNGEAGSTSGSYTLTVIPLGTADTNPNNQTIIGELQADTPVEGEITATHWQHLYTYTAQAADYIQVIAQRTSGTLYPLVEIRDANGESLRTGYNANAIADTDSYQLPSAGQYTIAVTRQQDQDGDTLGTYELTLHLVGSGEGSPNLAGTTGDVTYDTALDGTVTDVQWYQDWQLKSDAGDTITITVERTSGDLQPEISLIGGSGQELRHGYNDSTGASATIDRYDLAGPGTYTVRVLRAQGARGESSGAYSLTVTLIGSGEGSPKLDEPVGEITLGTPVAGEITNAMWQNAWTLNATEAGSIDVTVLRTDGTLVPRLSIRDANNQELRSAYYDDSKDRAEITNYQLPSAGTYRIVVIRDSDQDGYTTGKYKLAVSKSSQ